MTFLKDVIEDKSEIKETKLAYIVLFFLKDKPLYDIL